MPKMTAEETARGMPASFPTPRHVTNPFGDHRSSAPAKTGDPAWVRLKVPGSYPALMMMGREFNGFQRALAERVHVRDLFAYNNRHEEGQLWMLKNRPDPGSQDFDYLDDCYRRWKRWGDLAHIPPCPAHPNQFLTPEERDQLSAERDLRKKLTPIQSAIRDFERILANLRAELALLDKIEEAWTDAYLAHVTDLHDEKKEREFLTLSEKSARKQKFAALLTNEVAKIEAKLCELRKEERALTGS